MTTSGPLARRDRVALHGSASPEMSEVCRAWQNAVSEPSGAYSGSLRKFYGHAYP